MRPHSLLRLQAPCGPLAGFTFDLSRYVFFCLPLTCATHETGINGLTNSRTTHSEAAALKTATSWPRTPTITTSHAQSSGRPPQVNALQDKHHPVHNLSNKRLPVNGPEDKDRPVRNLQDGYQLVDNPEDEDG